MASNNFNGRLVLYGAVAEIPAMQGNAWRSRIKRLLDRLAFRAGIHSKLNYKNYQASSTYNRGDHSIIVATEQQLVHLPVKQRVVRVTWGDLKALNLTKNDKVLVCGSGYFFPSEKGDMPERLFEDLVLIESADCELHFLGAGFNFLLDWRESAEATLSDTSAKLVSALIKRASTITVRDQNTQNFLARYTERRIDVIGDPALFIKAPGHQLSLKQASTRPQVGINIPFHGKEPTQWIQRYLTRFTKTLQKLKATTNCEFTYFVHYDSELLVAELIRDKGVSLAIVNKEAMDLPAEYAKLNLHIGGMLHSCIIATAANIPSIGLAYDKKHHGFFDLMNRSAYCIEANNFDPDELLEKCLTLLDEAEEEKSRIESRRNQLEQKFLEVLRGIVVAEVN